ncbi:hypothetical protein BC829DRAFT_390100 [Chytridium lagenaria]|nr:hypothetical protein BC829DRAFT_390100 [Chytridium lagenaria]
MMVLSPTNSDDEVRACRTGVVKSAAEAGIHALVSFAVLRVLWSGKDFDQKFENLIKITPNKKNVKTAFNKIIKRGSDLTMHGSDAAQTLFHDWPAMVKRDVSFAENVMTVKEYMMTKFRVLYARDLSITALTQIDTFPAENATVRKKRKLDKDVKDADDDSRSAPSSTVKPITFTPSALELIFAQTLDTLLEWVARALTLAPKKDDVKAITYGPELYKLVYGFEPDLLFASTSETVALSLLECSSSVLPLLLQLFDLEWDLSPDVIYPVLVATFTVCCSKYIGSYQSIVEKLPSPTASDFKGGHLKALFKILATSWLRLFEPHAKAMLTLLSKTTAKTLTLRVGSGLTLKDLHDGSVCLVDGVIYDSILLGPIRLVTRHCPDCTVPSVEIKEVKQDPFTICRAVPLNTSEGKRLISDSSALPFNTCACKSVHLTMT